MFGYLGVPAKDLENLIALEMLSIILGEGTSSRLYQNLIEKSEEQIFSVIDAENYAFRDGSNFFVQANYIPEYKEKAVKLVKEEIEKVKQDITERELNKAKKKLKSRFASEAETVSEIGEAIGYYMTVCDDLALAEEYIPICESITVEDLQEVAKKVPLDRLVVETDSPFLPPNSKRGLRNQPAFIVETIDYLAALREMDKEELCNIMFENSLKAYNIKL